VGEEIGLIDRVLQLILFSIFLVSDLIAQAPIKLAVDPNSRGYAIPSDFAGLGFETKSVVANTYSVRGHFFSPGNTQLITLFRNMGIKHIRIGGGTVDGSGLAEHCVTPTPSFEDIDNLFEFAKIAGVKVIYSVRLENLASCPNPDLAEEDAKIVQYIWSKYRANLDSFSIGNEPDVREYHTRPGHLLDPAIYETTLGVAGSAYHSYLEEWKRFAEIIQKAVPEAKFSGPDTAVSDNSSFTPNSSNGVSWTQQFASDLRNSGLLVEALQHHYVWGVPENTTAQEAIDDMLSKAWDDDTSVGKQPARNGGTMAFHPYPYVYSHVLAYVASSGIPYRMTEANDCLHGVAGASDGYAAALWALDYMHWWAAHRMAGVDFHNNPWIPTDTVTPDPNPCSKAGCGDYRISPKGYGIKAFNLGSHGYVEPLTISNPRGINLTAYAVGSEHDLYITVINKTHSSTHDAIDAEVSIEVLGGKPKNAKYIELTNGDPGNAASMMASLGGATIANDAPWRGKWTSIGRSEKGKVKLIVHSTTAVVVWIYWP
jgi:hypothetical protein